MSNLYSAHRVKAVDIIEEEPIPSKEADTSEENKLTTENYNFEIEDICWIEEKFTMIGMAMDMHKSGVLLLEELVTIIVGTHAQHHPKGNTQFHPPICSSVHWNYPKIHYNSQNIHRKHYKGLSG